MAACTSSIKVPVPAEGPTHALLTVDSLMWQQPDTALACLVSCFDACTTTEYNRHYANLLLSELLYKNDYAQTNRPALRQAVAYFDSLVGEAPPLQRGSGGFPPLKGGKGNSKHKPISNNDHFFLAARAHYINGVGYYENDSAVPACREYLKALEIMEGRFEEKEMVGKKARFMALTYTRLSDVFSDFYLHEQAIHFGKKSMVYYYKYDASSRHVSRMLNEIGSHFDMMNRFDSASYYYRKSLMVLPDTNNLTYRDIATLLAFLSYKSGEVPKTSLNQLKRLLGQSETPKEALSRCAIVGEIYYQEKQFDSAWIYLNNVFNKSQSADSKKQVAERLVEICKAQGREEEIIKYAGFLVPFATQDEDKGIIKSQLAELCNKHKQHELELQHRLKAKKQTIWSIGVVVGLLMLMLCTFVLYRQKYRKKKKSLEIQIKEEQYAHEIKQKALAGRLKRSNEELKAQTKMKPVVVSLSAVQASNTAKHYADELVCKHILAVCSDNNNPIKSTVPVSAYTDIALTDAQKAQLKEAAMRHYGPLFEKLKQQYPKLKEKDFLYCQLCLLGLDNAQIAVLLQNTISTVWERENRLKRIFGTVDKVSVFLFGFMKN